MIFWSVEFLLVLIEFLKYIGKLNWAKIIWNWKRKQKLKENKSGGWTKGRSAFGRNDKSFGQVLATSHPCTESKDESFDFLSPACDCCLLSACCWPKIEDDMPFHLFLANTAATFSFLLLFFVLPFKTETLSVSLSIMSLPSVSLSLFLLDLAI